MIDIDVQGSEQIQQFMQEFGSKGKEIVEDELYKVAIAVRSDILKSMRGTPKVNGRSAPGFPPAVQTGGLWNRIIAEKGYGFSEVFEDTEYAKFLEEGTIKMEARPHFEPAIERSNWENRIVNRIIAERFAGRRLDE